VNDWQELLLNIQVWLGLAVAAGAPVACLWGSLPSKQRQLLPPTRRRAVPWGVADVYVALCAFFLYNPLLSPLVQAVLAALHGGRQPGRELVTLWSAAVALPLAVGTILFAMRRLSGTRPFQLGLTTHRWREDLTLGYLVWLGLTPAVLFIHFLALRWLEKVPHPFERLAEQPLSPVEWLLIVFLGVVQAPVLEELFFRGVLQPWLGWRPWGGHVAFAGAAVVSFPWGKLDQWPADPQQELLALAPVLFVLAMLPGYLLFLRLMRRSAIQTGSETRAVYATALLFAAFHAGAWPSPIALFALGLGLGWLARRTQSLTGPFFVHALFNAVASTVLVISKG
jgi:membrane protease YdiL (CAAX protease family)